MNYRNVFLAGVAFILFFEVNEAEIIRRLTLHHAGQSYEAALSRNLLDQAPLWRQEAEFPPLSPRAAVEQAKQHLQDLAYEFGTVESVALEPVGGREQWLYVVSFKQKAPNGIALGPQLTSKVMVLLNGKVVPFHLKRE